MPKLNDLLGTAFDTWKNGDGQSAAHMFETILQVEPNNPIALYGLGSIAIANNAVSTAQVLLEKSVRIDPKADWAWHNLGVTYKAMQNTEKAEACYKRALNLDPTRADTTSMVSGCYVNAGNPKKAVKWADKALAMNPTCPHAINHKALALLEMEEWNLGWELWLKRWENPDRKKMIRDYRCPLWDGSPLKKGEVIVLHGEQGLGDEILFMSLWDEFKAAVGEGEIIIEAAVPLVPTFKRSFGVKVYGTPEEVLSNEKPDYWISMGDLPPMFRRTKESFENQPLRFLRPDPVRVDYWRDRMESMRSGPHVGLAWWGGVAKTHSKIRNPPIKMWADLVKAFPDFNFVSAQYETGDVRMESEQIGVEFWPAPPREVDDRVALIQACDFVVTVCQTAHHIAGALGKETYTVVPKAAAWRYGLEGERNVWYPSVTQVRQVETWEGCFKALTKKLEARRDQ